MISKPRRTGDYPDREVDCQEAMEAGFQAIIDCMLEAGWTRDEAKRALRRLVAADNMTQKEQNVPVMLLSRWLSFRPITII